MNKITKLSVVIAFFGAAAFTLHSGDYTPATSHTIDPVSSVQAVPAGPLAASVDSKPLGMNHLATAEQEMLEAGPVFNTDVETTVASTQSATAAEAGEEQERKERTARSKMSGPVAALAMAGGPTPTEIIVSYADRPDLLEDKRIEKLGGEIVRHYEILELLAIRIPAEALIELAIEDSVDHVSMDAMVRTTSTVSKVAANDPVYPSGNAAYHANNVKVAVLDSGVASHPDLRYSTVQFSFLDGHFPEPELEDGEIDVNDTDGLGDDFGHGTHVAGIIGGSGKYSSGDYSGPANRARIISLQVLDENGYGQTSDVMAALEWLMKYGPYLDIRVANLSLGKPITESNTTDPLVRAVEEVWRRGIVVTVAAGNFGREGYFSTTSPGNSRKVITVGSLTDNGTGEFSDDYASTYSSKGPTAADHVIKPDLVAPGNRLIAATPMTSTLASLLPNNKVDCTASSQCEYNYLELSGTSMATGMVSAAAALMIQKDPSLTPATVKARLMRSARKLGESPIVAGAGLLDIDAAMNETGIVNGDALSPLMAFDEESGGTLIQDTATLWGDEIWGAGYLWTNGGINANGYLWTDGGVNANGYLWTDGGVNANGYIWTDGGVFANGYLWTDGGVAAFGYLWTDGVNANGYLWTDGVNANGYLWTDGVNANALYDLYSDNPALNDD